MRIVDVTTTELHIPSVAGIQDATIRHRVPGRGGLFVHVRTDEGLEGLGVGQPGARELIARTLKELLVGQDPLCHEKLWDDMFWRVRGFGRKGLAFCAISAVDIALWDLKAKAFGVPLYRLLGPYTDSVPIYGSGGWTHFTEAQLVAEQLGYVERGIPRVKLKVAKDFGQAEAEDLRRLAAVRRAVGDGVEIYVDANNGYYAKHGVPRSDGRPVVAVSGSARPRPRPRSHRGQALRGVTRAPGRSVILISAISRSPTRRLKPR